jgi:hypothetical protein
MAAYLLAGTTPKSAIPGKDIALFESFAGVAPLAHRVLDLMTPKT